MFHGQTVTVIIPALGEEDSILAVVDNGSVDNTARVREMLDSRRALR